ncbi:HAMP domain-containing sensor histidine kinase [Asinibacterium sp. OR53]|uniref:sensor histidine kinase n=1 Tax=Asinibacterium sp. OR53 TaxID=925409 RepID=UPI00047BBE49|nr:ATP-binding protein [Asinibacterium sp. OR53]
MQIRTRLTLLFTALAAAILLAFALIVYVSFSQTREDEYYKRLKQQATIKANLLFDTKIDPGVLQLIYKNTPDPLFQEEVAIYDTGFHLLYHDAVDIDKVKETRTMIDQAIAQKELRFYVKDMQVVAFIYTRQDHTYVVTAAAKDGNGLAKLASLRNTLLVVFVGAIVLIFLAGRFFARQSLKPVATMVDKVKTITATNLDFRVAEGNRKDEIASLAITFNEMLNRLENSFDAQKHFVSNISHELRTPLTAMLTELQLTASKERSNEEYKGAITHIIGDTKKIIRLSNSLLDLAKASYDQTEIAFKELRIDEVLLDARNDVLHNQPGVSINIRFEKEIENDDFVSVQGNEYLLKAAFSNLMENGCKFSANKQSTASISYDQQHVILHFADTGIGIPADELAHIFTPFYRGKNKQFTDGNGIGLPLTQKIIKLHNGDLSVHSRVGEGTVFTIEIPHI